MNDAGGLLRHGGQGRRAPENQDRKWADEAQHRARMPRSDPVDKRGPPPALSGDWRDRKRGRRLAAHMAFVHLEQRRFEVPSEAVRIEERA